MIRYAAGHPTVANLLMLAILVLGLLALPGLKRESFPEIPPDRIQVSVAFPGAAPRQVEDAICRPIEDGLDKLTGIEEVACEALEGMGRATVTMEEGGDFDRLAADVKAEVDAIDRFPDDAELPTVRQLGRTDFVASVAITGPMGLSDLKAYAEAAKDRALRHGGISQVEIKGFSDHQLRVALSASDLHRHGLSVDDVAAAIARQNLDLPVGAIETTERDVLVRFADERRGAAEIADLVVLGGESGGQVRLGDIATVTDTFELEEEAVIYNGRRAALLEISKTRAEDTLEAIAAVRTFVSAENAVSPPGVEMAITRDGSSNVRDRLRLVRDNGLQGLVLVFLVMWLFFGLRYSFWVTMGLPVAFLGTLFAMGVVGFSINMMSLVALLIAVGLIMDDAIVIAENINTHRRRGATSLDAAVNGTREVLPGVISSFLTTALIFGSLAFLEGRIGMVLRVVPMVLLLTLAVSLIEAFLILPHHLLHTLERGQEPTGLRARFEAGLDWTRERVVGSFVDACVRWRYLTAGVMVGLLLLAVSALAGGHLKFQAFPEIDGDVVEARILLPQGTPLARTRQVVDRVVGALHGVDARLSPEQPDGQALVRAINVQFNTNVDSYESGPHVATVSADLLGAEVRTASSDRILSLWRELSGEIPDLVALKFAEFQIGVAGRAIDIRLYGNDLERLKAASSEMVAWLERFRGVHDVGDDLRAGKPEVRLRLRDGALALGLDAAAVAEQLRTAFLGRTAAEVQVGPESYEIDVRLDAADQDSLADLEDFRITAADGAQVPLGVVAVLEQGRDVARINRIDGRRTVTIQGEVDTRIANANAVVGALRSDFLPGFLERHPGIATGLEGQAKEGAKTGGSLVRGFAVGLLGVFLILSFQFRSYVEPLVVMLVIPFAFMGVVAGHLLLGLDMSMPSMLGFASLAGIAVNDSILLVAFTRKGMEAGLGVEEAARQASRARFRAVLLTSLTTVAGLLPMLTEGSLQAQVLKPLITSLAFGLAASTVMVLFLVPVLYAILHDIGLTRKEPRAAQEPVRRAA